MSLRGTVATGMETASHVPDIYKLTLLEKSEARFTRLLTKIRKRMRRVHNPEYKTQERRPRGVQTQINNGAGYSNSATSLVVDDSTIFSVGDCFIIPRTGELFRITAITYGTHTLTVATRPVAGSATAIDDNDYILRLGRTMNEGYTVGASWMTDTTQVTNYAQTISTPVEWTNLQMKTWSYLSPDQREDRMASDKESMAIEHLREIERVLMFSKKSKTTDSDSKNLYTTNGLIPSLTTNIYDHSGGTALTEDEFNTEIIQPLWNHGGAKEKWGLCSNVTLGQIESYGRDKFRTMDTESNELGFDVVAYRTSRGTIRLAHYPEFDNSNYYAEAMVNVDLNYVRIAMLQDTKYEPNIGNAKDKARLDEWSTIVGLDLEYEETCGFARDLITAAS